MNWLLDTNACIRYLNGRAPRLRDRLSSAAPDDVVVCSVVKTELFFGAARSRDPRGNLARQLAFLSYFRSLPFDDQCAQVSARIRAELAARGTPRGPYDLLIAATAIANGVTLVTHNLAEFTRIEGLTVEDWEA